jgi:hypothetical protein
MRSVALLILQLVGLTALSGYTVGQGALRAATEQLALEAADANPTTPNSKTNATRKTSANPSRDAILQMAQEGYEHIRRDIQDYSCILVKRERVDGRLGDYQYMRAKVRHARTDQGRDIPFSVYLKFLGPEDLKGREVLYVEGQNDKKIVARKGGFGLMANITTQVGIDSELAMRDNRYSITNFGIENLVQRFLERLDSALLEDCTIQRLEGSKVDGRPCRCVQVTKNHRTRDAEFYVARVYIDEELQIPIHYEAFDWPSSAGGSPRLLEQYTYRQIKLNVGFTDADFQRDNPAYGFRK